LPVYSKDFTINANTNLLKEINPKTDVQYAFDGGVFQALPKSLSIKNNGKYTLLILDSNDDITSHNINVINGQDSQFSHNNKITVDNKAPLSEYKWKNVISKGNQVITGPKSQLNWQVNEPGSSVKLLIDGKQIKNTNNPILITNQMSNIEIHAIDAFDNQSKTVIPFIKDFNEPDINWKLNPPSIKKNNQWYANQTAELVITRESSINYSVNNKLVNNGSSAVKITNNSQIIAEDKIGNKTKETISWKEDKTSPQLIVKTLNKTYENPKKMNVKVGQKIRIQTNDDVVGLLSSEYSINKIDWKTLPKTFVFVDTGLYRLNFRSSDKLGNTLVAHIVFKITL